jgi:chromosome segregation ATPase
MANDNKNTHELASDLDDDTSELELLSATYAADPALDYEAESDAATHSFESLDSERERKSLGTLQVELRERDEYIGRLEYDLEQLRARSSGLEAELRVREALTESATAERNEARQALQEARERLEQRDQAFTELESRLAGSESSLQEARHTAESARSEIAVFEARAAEDARRLHALGGELEQAGAEREQAQAAERDQAQRLAQLEERHAESRSLVDTLRQYIEGRKERWEQQEILLRRKDDLLETQQRKIGAYEKAGSSGADNVALRELTAERDTLRAELDALQQEAGKRADAAAAREETIAFRLAEIDSLATQLAEISSEYEKEREDRQTLEAQCNALEERMQQLAADAAELETAAEHVRPLQQENARLAGEILGHTDEIRGLRDQTVRIEAYADSLRRKLQAQGAELETVATSQRSIQAALDDALSRVAELREQVAAERRASAALAEEHGKERERLESDLRNLRADLETAREAIDEGRATNEQLAADLIETTGSRLSLETQLSQAEEGNRQKVEKLERQVKRLKQELEAFEGKVANKDAAISVLLAELSHKPQSAGSEVQPDGTPNRPGDRRLRAGDEKHAPDRERTTRLLVGTIDGQEVRFPLFKNKLTIGRTAHNDIQLKQQFISRRHAVVVCDNDSTRIVDWGSKNGIHVNGIRVSEKVLKSGDQLTVGTAEFRFEELPKR